jgi:PAS domain S-box-containing protein
MFSRFAPDEVSRISAMLFQTAAEGLVVVDHLGTIMLINPRITDLFGHAMDDLIGQPIEVLIPTHMREGHVTSREGYQKAPVERPMGIGRELLGQRKDGSLFPVEVSLNHFEFDGKPYVMGLVTDVTQRRRVEKELQRTNAELEERVVARTTDLLNAEKDLRKALEAEKELNALKSRFVSMASHEFRTPLSTVMSSVDLIARYTEGSVDAKVHKHVERIRGKVRDMTNMLNEFLSLEKLEQGLVQCHPSEVDVVHLCIELIEELRGLAKPGQEIQYDHTGVDRMVFQDRQMLSVVLSNLLSNAIKYSPAETLIDLRTSINEGLLNVTVKDRGIGIPPEDRAHILERFFRAGNAFTVQGTGLGLNIAARFIDIMGGTIQFESLIAGEPGDRSGTTFHVQIQQHHEQKNDPADRG